VAISVLDRGPGVPEGERGRIFDKFYRVPGAYGGGAGLGLAICRGIVEAHGGRIDVSGREGGGAAFRFTLPIEGTPPAVEEDGA
jgi:two-component system sensor histidine kinase KdpD